MVKLELTMMLKEVERLKLHTDGSKEAQYAIESLETQIKHHFKLLDSVLESIRNQERLRKASLPYIINADDSSSSAVL